MELVLSKSKTQSSPENKYRGTSLYKVLLAGRLPYVTWSEPKLFAECPAACHGELKMKAAFTRRGAIQDQGIRHIYGRFDATSGVVVGS